MTPFAKALLQWYDSAKRDLPWRVASGFPNPYHVLVSEAMLQQTQVATVIPYFARFLAAFPTIESLAESEEQRVLRLWQGLGYYSRARNLRKAAIAVVEQFGGVVPHAVEDLLTLPGVGRYTAGAVASLAYDTVAPIVDGNVVRVICRIDAIEEDPREPLIQKQLWRRAEEMLPTKRAGDFNSALMELGATVCTPKTPACLICPVRKFCRAFDQQIQHRVPMAKKAKTTPLQQRWVLCVEDQAGRFLIEQRPATGRWAGMWQFLTTSTADENTALTFGTTPPTDLGIVRHAL
ncbi:MAG: A/G-specific adenine glycosylase, partial [Phycisphaerales bacterium]|nr:A/G-specific adenine glycosylase [Phycisphaerales bacterium]